MADRWFVSNGKKQLGPFTPAKMRALAQAGKLRPTMRISPDGASWIKASESEFLKGSANPGRPAKARTAELDPLPDPFADGAAEPDDDSGVIDSGAPDDDSGVTDDEDDDDSGVIAAIPDPANDDDDDSGEIASADDDDPVSEADPSTGTTPPPDDAPDVLDGAAFADEPAAADDPTEPGEPYRYRARGSDGREIADELRAESAAQAFRQIRERGLTPILALPKRGFAGWPDRQPPPPPPAALERVLARAAALATRVDRLLLALARYQAKATAKMGESEPARSTSVAILYAFVAGVGLLAASHVGTTAAGLISGVTGLTLIALAASVAWATTRAAIDRARIAYGLLAEYGRPPRAVPSRARLLAALPGIALGAALCLAGADEVLPHAFAWIEPPTPATWLALVATATLDAAEPFGFLDFESLSLPVPISVSGWVLRALAQAIMLAALALTVVRELAERLPLRAALRGLGHPASRPAAIAALSRWVPPPVAQLMHELAREGNPGRRRAIAECLAELPASLVHPALVTLAADDRARLARDDVAWTIGRIAAPGGAEQLATWLVAPRWHADRPALLAALAATADRHGAPGLAAFLADPNHHDLHLPAARALIALDDPEWREAMWALLEVDRPRPLRVVGAAGLSRIGSEDDIPLLDAVLDDEPDSLVARWVRRALEAISNPESRGTLAALELELDAMAKASDETGPRSFGGNDPDATVRTPAEGPSPSPPGEV